MQKIVVHIIPKLDYYGGIENIIRLFIEKANSSDQKLFIITFDNVNEQKFVEKARKKEVQIIALKKTLFELVQNRVIRFILKNILISHYHKYLLLKKNLQEIKPQIVFAHGEDAELISSFLNNEFIVVNVIHGSNYFPKNKIYKTYLNQFARKKFHHTVIVSSILKKHIPFGKDYSVIPAGIDLEHFVFNKRNFGIKDKSELHFGFIGRIEHEKGIDEIVKAFLKVQKKYPNIILNIVGEGKLKKKLLHLLAVNKIRNIIFHNRLKDPKTFYDNLEFLIIYSESEGGPLVALEAMASGVIVISNEVGLIPKLIKDGENGFILKNNNEDELINVIERSILSGDVSDSIVHNSLRTVKDYSAEKMINEYDKLINKII